MSVPLKKLRQIVKTLRAPDGCPWDIEQTPQTITPHIIEEAYELVDAIKKEDSNAIKDELSDQLLHVVMIAEMMSESGHFDLDDVINHCSEKMIRRHPHVFGTESSNSSNEITKKWEEIKAKENPNQSIVDSIPNHLPALMHAQKIQRKVAQVGFDWPDLNGPIDKLIEECTELANAVGTNEINEEIGDILFTIVNICRKLNTSAEELLQGANSKFKKRFKSCEDIAKAHNKSLKESTIEEIEIFWDQAKKLQK